MNSWLALVKKEFLLTRAVFLAALVFIFIVWGFSYVLDYLAIGEGTAEINESAFAGPVMLSLMTTGVFMHAFYMPIYMIVSMQKELSTFHLWLHTPQPMAKLLSTKLTSGLFCMVISLFINGTIALSLIFLQIPEEFMPTFWNTASVVGILGGGMVAASLYFGLYVLLFIAIYLSLRGTIGKWAWIVLIGLFIALNWVFNKVQSTVWYQAMTGWGTFSINMDAGQLAPIFPIDIPFGLIFTHLILAIIIFVIATVLMDRKAEV